MELEQLEKAIRKAVQAHPGRPTLALLAGAGAGNTSLPEEFATSVRTLASRSDKARPAKGLLDARTESWI